MYWYNEGKLHHTFNFHVHFWWIQNWYWFSQVALRYILSLMINLILLTLCKLENFPPGPKCNFISNIYTVFSPMIVIHISATLDKTLPGFRRTGLRPMRGLLTRSSLQGRCCLRGGDGRRQDMVQVECVTRAVFAGVSKLILGWDVEIYEKNGTYNQVYRKKITYWYFKFFLGYDVKICKNGT